MLEKLRSDPHKIPTPSRDEIMALLLDSWTRLQIDAKSALKNNLILNNFNGTEDYLVSDKLFSVIGAEMVEFRKELLNRPAPKTIKDLMLTITPPKGVKMKAHTLATKQQPQDEGSELLDCEGAELNEYDRKQEELDENGRKQEELDENDRKQEELDENGRKQEELYENDRKQEELDETVVQCDNCLEPSTSSRSTSTVVGVGLSSTLSTGSVLDESLKNDCDFLDKMKDILYSTSTSTLFRPHISQFRTAYSRARHSLKKRIKTCKIVSGLVRPSSPLVNDVDCDNRERIQVPSGPSSPLVNDVDCDNRERIQVPSGPSSPLVNDVDCDNRERIQVPSGSSSPLVNDVDCDNRERIQVPSGPSSPLVNDVDCDNRERIQAPQPIHVSMENASKPRNKMILV